MDHDDWAVVLPPEDKRDIVETMSGSGVPIRDCRLAGFEPVSNHPSGGFFGPEIVGRNFRTLLELHPTYVDPNASLAGAYMANFMSYRTPHWNPEISFAHLTDDHKRYGISPGIGGVQHFCQDMSIGIELGWGGLLEKIRRYRAGAGDAAAGFYVGLEHVVIGVQSWIRRTAAAARTAAASARGGGNGGAQGAAAGTATGSAAVRSAALSSEGAETAAPRTSVPSDRANLLQIAEMNERLVTEPPRTLREACQWTLWFLMTARMYNGSGSLGRLDLLLHPFYQRETRAGTLTDEEAVFHIACLLLRDTAYVQLGGLDADGRDDTNPVSYLVLEAAHKLGIPVNTAVAAGKDIDPELLRRGVEVIVEDRLGTPKFLGMDNTAAGYERAGFAPELGRCRVYAGCHWHAVPGREYTHQDMIKINLGKVFDAALRDMMSDVSAEPSTEELWRRFERHLERSVQVVAAGIDIHADNMHAVFPELVMDLLCHGPIESGRDASNEGVELTNYGVDGAALATVADSFAAVEQRIEREARMSWAELIRVLDDDWAGPDGEAARLMMRGVPRFGSGGSRADGYARRIAQAFAGAVRARPTPKGRSMLPGLFSWANTIPMGRELGATPNGRHAGAPISHGANPDPGFSAAGAPTALAKAVADVQPGYGNTAPAQIDLTLSAGDSEAQVEYLCALIRTHFELGGTQINLNVIDAETILEADRDPSTHPDLIVRVTGFSAYFSSLSPEFRRMVVDRMLSA